MPVGLRRPQVAMQDLAARAHCDSGRSRIQMGDEQGRLARYAQSFALADGEGGDAAMAAQDLAAGIDNRAWSQRLGAAPAQIGNVVVVRHETDLLTVGLVVHRQAHAACLLAHVSLAGHVAQGKQNAPENLARNSKQHVGLVLVPRRLAPDGRMTAGRHDTRVVAGGHPRNPQRVRVANEPPELDPGVARDTRIGRAALPIFVDEILDDGLEGVREIQHIELDAQLVRHRARVGRVLGRAAPARVTVRVAGHAQAHEHARDLKPRVAQQPGRHRRIHPAAHGHEHPFLTVSRHLHSLASFFTTENTEAREE